MKTTTTLLTMFVGLLALQAEAQNIELHYDFGRSLYDKEFDGRPLLTSTVDKFHPDQWGSTYFFVDMDYTSDGVGAAYWEISRELTFWKGPLSAHVEYNGGLAKSFSYNNAYLVGPTYTYNNASFSSGFSVMALYKYIQKHQSPHNFQLTGTWYINFNNDLLTFSGFADWWREETAYGKTIFLSEPQFWVNLNKVKGISDKLNLSVGTEVKVFNNFGNQDGLYVIPTLALKWAFK